MNVILKISKLSLFVLIFISFYSCSKDVDLISEYLVRDKMKMEYHSVYLNSNFEKESEIENKETDSVTKR